MCGVVVWVVRNGGLMVGERGVRLFFWGFCSFSFFLREGWEGVGF